MYRIKKLIEGRRMGQPSGWMVAVPGHDFNTGKDFENCGEFEVEFEGQRMKVEDWKKAITFRIFDDKQGRGKYTLGYFFWNP